MLMVSLSLRLDACVLQEYCERLKTLEWFAELVIAEIWDLQERVIQRSMVLPTLAEVLGIANDAQPQPHLLKFNNVKLVSKLNNVEYFVVQLSSFVYFSGLTA